MTRKRHHLDARIYDRKLEKLSHQSTGGWLLFQIEYSPMSANCNRSSPKVHPDALHCELGYVCLKVPIDSTEEASYQNRSQITYCMRTPDAAIATYRSVTRTIDSGKDSGIAGAPRSGRTGLCYFTAISLPGCPGT